jgi:hypothetical protein
MRRLHCDLEYFYEWGHDIPSWCDPTPPSLQCKFGMGWAAVPLQWQQFRALVIAQLSSWDL